MDLRNFFVQVDWRMISPRGSLALFNTLLFDFGNDHKPAV